MMLAIVRKLPAIDQEEIIEHQSLTVAHWLVLAELIPLDREFRRFWAIRCVNMGFTAKIMRDELSAAIAQQEKVGADYQTRKKDHKG